MRIIAECAEAGQTLKNKVVALLQNLSHVKAGVRVACWLFGLWKAGFL